MRIVITAGNIPTTTFIDALINTMANEGFQMILIGKRGGKYQYHKNVEVVILPSNKIGQFLFILKNIVNTDFKSFRKIFNKRKNFATLFYDLYYFLPIVNAKPDKIHIQWTNFLHELYFELFPGKILLSLRGAHINYKPITHPEIKKAYLKMFPNIHRFHAVSDAIGIEAMKYNAAKEKIQTIYSYVSDEIVKRNILPKEKAILKIISVGRFHWKKGYDYALDAMAILKLKKTNFIYTIIAQGNIPDDIIFQIDQLNLKDNLTIINGLTHDAVIKKIEESDLLLLPSVEEGIANVALEAMAVGTPVISTDCGGMNEVIDNNISGIIVNNRDSEALANAIETFNNFTETERFSLATYAKKRITEHHNSHIFKQNFFEFYK